VKTLASQDLINPSFPLKVAAGLSELLPTQMTKEKELPKISLLNSLIK
jgi:hypothetical protein